MADVTDTFYPATDAMVGYGTQWLIGDGASPETFQAVEAVVSFEAGGETTAVIDTTHLRSPGRHREVRAGMITSAPFTGSSIFLPQSESQSYAGGGTGSFVNGGLAKIAETGESQHEAALPGRQQSRRGTRVPRLHRGVLAGERHHG